MSVLRRFVKAVLPPPATIRLRSAFKQHEPERAMLPALCDPARTGLDIGAALGAYTWPLSRLCTDCIAFEPNPDQAAYLRRALGSRARVENVALSDRNGAVELVVPLGRGDEQAGQATIAPGTWLEGRPVRRVLVLMHTLDSFSLPSVGFIKLDVEGHELAVLHGGSSLLAKDKPVILVELEERFHTGNIARVQELLTSLGYRGLYLDRGRLHDIVRFDPSLHQRIENWGSHSVYINNFIFIAHEALESTLRRIVRLGYAIDV
jgi:FkbM family methyltransferase